MSANWTSPSLRSFGSLTVADWFCLFRDFGAEKNRNRIRQKYPGSGFATLAFQMSYFHERALLNRIYFTGGIGFRDIVTERELWADGWTPVKSFTNFAYAVSSLHYAH